MLKFMFIFELQKFYVYIFTLWCKSRFSPNCECLFENIRLFQQFRTRNPFSYMYLQIIIFIYFYTFLFKSLDIYFYKKYCHCIYSLCYLSEVTQYLVPRRIGLILLILVQYCAVLEGAFQGRCASQISASHIYVADVLRSLWFHVIRLFSTRCQMRRYVKKFNLVYPFYSWCTLNLKFFFSITFV